MKKILTYTTRTYPYPDVLQSIFNQVFIFGDLKKDLKIFKDIIDREQPDLIIGIADSTRSRWEPIAINRFHGDKLLVKNGPEQYNLFIPNDKLPAATQPTDSFCNWTMYHVAHHLNIQSYNIKLAFTHINTADLNVALKIIM